MVRTSEGKALYPKSCKNLFSTQSLQLSNSEYTSFYPTDENAVMSKTNQLISVEHCHIAQACAFWHGIPITVLSLLKHSQVYTPMEYKTQSIYVTTQHHMLTCLYSNHSIISEAFKSIYIMKSKTRII
jgi:hypothetical protein